MRLGILAQLVAATGHLHCLGYAHRDIKPANVLLTNQVDQTGTPLVKLADFGQAKRVFSESSQQHGLSLSTSTAEIGSPQYAQSPELRKPHTRHSGFGGDIFSLGIILFEMLSRFDTMMERAQTLGAFEKTNRVPARFTQQHPWATRLIENMTAADVSERSSIVSILHAVHCVGSI